jgi:hypothetical protein
MTKTEYQIYEENVSKFLECNQVKPGCYSHDSEPFFSWSACECCGEPNGGDRYETGFARKSKGDTFTATICSDCVYYLTYGRLNDQTLD